MKISKEDVSACIKVNPLLHGLTNYGLTNYGLSARREPGWSDPKPYPESLDTEMLETIGFAIDWLTRPLDAGGSISHRDELHPRASSYSLKHRFEHEADRYIPEGAFIVALAMAGCRLKRNGRGSHSVHSTAWPSEDALHRMAFTTDYRLDTNGSRDRLTDPIAIQKKLLGAFARAATGTDVATTQAFWEWVCERRATANVRGDFIRDARSVRDDRNAADGWHEGCLLRLACATVEADGMTSLTHQLRHLARQYCAESG